MKEFEDVVGKVKSDQELVEKALQLVEEFDFEALLVTRSKPFCVISNEVFLGLFNGEVDNVIDDVAVYF